MEKLYVPIMNSAVNEDNRQGYLKEFSRLKIDVVFIALDRDLLFFKDERDVALKRLKENVKFFKSNGYEVGVWFNAYGFGTPMTEKQIKASEKYVRIKSVKGVQNNACDALCPECAEFTLDYTNFVKDVAKVGCKMMMLDDDFCLSVRPGLGCFCDNHIKLLEEELKEKLEGKDLKNLFFSGGKNRYRDAYLKVMKQTNLRFANAVRKSVDTVDESIRVGFCAGFTSWDIEGVNAIELTRALAGKTKPFLRFTGAPYWASKAINRFRGMHLSAVVEEARSQETFSRDLGVEIFIEADSYPRPRYTIPSSHIECFSLPMYASGGVGELFYCMDYTSSPEYERGYIDHRLYNKPLYDFIEKHFTDKICSGVKVFNTMNKLREQYIEENDTEYDIMTSHFNRGAQLLAINGIPTTYEDMAECGIAFGEEARHVNNFCKKMIVDIRGAEILKEKGFDLGYEEKTVIDNPLFECVGNERISLSLGVGGVYYDVKLKEKATPLSFYKDKNGCPSAYKYLSNDVEFLVLCFDASKINHQASILCSYLRAEQLHEFCGRFPRIKKANKLYQILKKNAEQTAVLFVNINEDPVINGEIILDDEYSSMEICGADGEFLSNKIKLKSVIHPFGVVAILLKK